MSGRWYSLRALALVAVLTLVWALKADAQTPVCTFDEIAELAGATSYVLAVPVQCQSPAVSNGRITVIDNTGVAGSTNVTITAASGLINNSSSIVFFMNHEAITFFWDGLNWSAM